jgi:CDP-4-dehydro-6-deoxyglucose reductase
VAHGKAAPEVLAKPIARPALPSFAAPWREASCHREQGGRSLDDLPVRTLPARVQKMTRAAPEVMIVELKLPASERLQFLAGQYVDILLKEGKRRSFSLANPPHEDAFLQLHVRHIPGGQFTVTFSRPCGSATCCACVARTAASSCARTRRKPMLLVAGGTGFAPIKAIVEHAIAEGNERPMVVYWGGRGQRRPLPPALAEQWPAQHPELRFTPVLSDSPPAKTGRPPWPGACRGDGRPSRPVRHQAYVCGSPAMVAAARRDFLTRCQLPPEEFFADSFDYAPIRSPRSRRPTSDGPEGRR